MTKFSIIMCKMIYLISKCWLYQLFILNIDNPNYWKGIHTYSIFNINISYPFIIVSMSLNILFIIAFKSRVGSKNYVYLSWSWLKLIFPVLNM